MFTDQRGNLVEILRTLAEFRDQILADFHQISAKFPRGPANMRESRRLKVNEMKRMKRMKSMNK